MENFVLYQLTRIFFLQILNKLAVGIVLKEMVHDLAVHLSSYGCTWEVGRALEKLEKHSASPRATQTLLSCSPNFPARAPVTR